MLNEKLLNEVQKVTLTDYSDCENIEIAIIEDLVDYIKSQQEHYQEEIEKINQNIQDNYKRLTTDEML